MARASRGAARVTGLCIDNPSLECRREPARADARSAGQADSGKGWWSGARREGRGDARRIAAHGARGGARPGRSEEPTSELQSLMPTSDAVFSLTIKPDSPPQTTTYRAHTLSPATA